jgi:hypothetical protein
MGALGGRGPRPSRARRGIPQRSFPCADGMTRPPTEISGELLVSFARSMSSEGR